MPTPHWLRKRSRSASAFSPPSNFRRTSYDSTPFSNPDPGDPDISLPSPRDIPRLHVSRPPQSLLGRTRPRELEDPDEDFSPGVLATSHAGTAEPPAKRVRIFPRRTVLASPSAHSLPVPALPYQAPPVTASPGSFAGVNLPLRSISARRFFANRSRRPLPTRSTYRSQSTLPFSRSIPVTLLLAPPRRSTPFYRFVDRNPYPLLSFRDLMPYRPLHTFLPPTSSARLRYLFAFLVYAYAMTRNERPTLPLYPLASTIRSIQSAYNIPAALYVVDHAIDRIMALRLSHRLTPLSSIPKLAAHSYPVPFAA